MSQTKDVKMKDVKNEQVKIKLEKRKDCIVRNIKKIK